MTKQDLVSILAKKTGCSKNSAVDCLNTLLAEMSKVLATGKSIILTGFGTFKVSKRAARQGRNPKTGATIKISARNVVRFSAGKELKRSVNKK